jgi:hypothetical protein
VAAVLATGLVAAEPRVSLEGEGPFHMDDLEHLEPVLRRAVSQRFAPGFEEAAVTFRAGGAGSPAEVHVDVRGPEGLPEVTRVEAWIEVRGWRKALDSGQVRNLGIDLARFQVELGPGPVSRAVRGDHRDGDRWVRVVAGGLVPRGEGETYQALRAAAQESGVPVAPNGLLVNRSGGAVWVFEGRLGPPISRPGMALVAPGIAPGGELAVRVLGAASKDQALGPREVLALERRMSERMARAWDETERRLGGEGYLDSVEALAGGAVRLAGMGFAAFDKERWILEAAARRRAWRPSLLVNPAR